MVGNCSVDVSNYEASRSYLLCCVLSYRLGLQPHARILLDAAINLIARGSNKTKGGLCTARNRIYQRVSLKIEAIRKWKIGLHWTMYNVMVLLLYWIQAVINIIIMIVLLLSLSIIIEEQNVLMLIRVK